MSGASDAQMVRFGLDGWHGQLAREVSFTTIDAVARAAGIVLTRDEPSSARIVVGYDRRFLADRFARSIATQLGSIGIEPWLIPRPVPTSVLSYAVRSVSASGGIMVTAGAQPAEISGIKIRGDDGGALSRTQLEEIERLVNDGAQIRPVGPTASLVETDPIDEYLEAVARQVPVRSIQRAGITVAIDSMWGTASELLPRLTDGDGSRSVEIRTGHNPRFPDLCAPDPVESNLDRLRRTVRSGNAAFGVAFSGDASVLGLIDEAGQYVPPERVFAIVAYYLLTVKRVRGVVGRSVALPTDLERLAARARAPVRELGFGLSEISDRLRSEDFRLVGDHRGSVIVPRHLPDSDAILTAMLLCACVVESGQSISELLAEIDDAIGTLAFRRLTLPLTAEQRSLVQSRLERMERPPEVDGHTVRSVHREHGVKFELDGNAWLLVRLGIYDDVLVVVAEAPEQETVDSLVERGRQLMLL